LRKRLLTSILVLLFSLSVLGNESGEERIVTLGPAVTNQILLLGSGDEIVGKTSYCDSSAGINGEVVEVGTLLALSLESIVSLSPTIVFASGLTPQRVQNTLRQLGITVIEIEDPKSYSVLCDNFQTIGTAIGKEDLADSIITVSQTKYNELAADLEIDKAKRTFVELGSHPLYSIVKGSLGDELITLIGGKNIFNLTTSGEVSRESVIRLDPEVILITDMGISAREEKDKWQSFTTLAAAKENHIHVIDSYKIGSPTVVTFLETVIEIRTLIGFNDEIN